MTREEQIAGLMKIAGFFKARADMAVGDAKMLLLNWMKCTEEAAEWMREQKPRVMTLEEVLALEQIETKEVSKYQYEIIFYPKNLVCGWFDYKISKD